MHWSFPLFCHSLFASAMAEESGAAAPVVPEEVPAEAAEEQPSSQSPAKKRKVGAALKEHIWGSKLDQWVQAKDQLVPLDELEVGVGIEKGQVRQLREELVQKRLDSLQQVPPDRPVDVTVWNPSVADPSMLPLFSTCFVSLSSSPPQRHSRQ